MKSSEPLPFEKEYLANCPDRSADVPKQPRRKHRRSRGRGKRIRPQTLAVALLSLVSLLGTFVALWLHYTSEQWWGGLIFTYLPKSVLLLPTGLLLVGSVFWHRKSIVINLFCVTMVAGPLMDLKLPPLSSPALPHKDLRVRLASCNVQGFEPDFGLVLEEVSRSQPNVIAFQEAYGSQSGQELLKRYFRSREDWEWNVVHDNVFFVASEFPVEHVETFKSSLFDWPRPTAMHVIVHAPWGPFRLVNIHLMTARHGFSGLKDFSGLITGQSIGELTGFAVQRDQETLETAKYIRSIPQDMPLLIVGDFNVPSHSSAYTDHWSEWTNCFDEVGFGYGYTAPNAEMRIWPDHTPWLRIDHALCSSEWNIHRCRIGTGKGSDHRPLLAILSVKDAKQ